MDLQDELPLGFGMVLFQNDRSMQFFSRCSRSQKDAILKQARLMHSRQAMQDFVDHLPDTAFPTQ